MNPPEIKPRQVRALLLLLVLVPLIPGVLLVRLMLGVNASGRESLRQQDRERYQEALRMTQASQQGRSSDEVRRFYEQAFGGKVRVVLVDEAGELAGGEPVATRSLPDGKTVALYLNRAVQEDDPAADPLARIALSAVLISLGIALLAALGLNRRWRVRELESNALATVAHELKTPLASSRVLLETLLEGRLRDDAQRREYLEILSRENARLAQVVESFLITGRLRHGAAEAERVRVEALAAAVVSAKMKGRVETRLPPGLPAVRGDPEALATALGNLLENALKFSDGTVRLTAARSGKAVEITVTDQGIGIARRDQRRIFERFEQVDRKLSRVAEGCGLGLSIVREIVEAHGGWVKVSSGLGRGSVFTITLPRADSRAE